MTDRRFALVDRDGTINVERNHLTDPDELQLLPGAAAALVRLRDQLGYGIAVVTNQAHVGRGLLAPATLGSIHGRLLELLQAEGADVDGIFVCPHAPEEGCACRKPAPGLALQAAERFGFDPADAIVIGDTAGDIGMGRAVGAETILVRTGYGSQPQNAASGPDRVADDLAGAVAIIARRDREADG